MAQAAWRARLGGSRSPMTDERTLMRLLVSCPRRPGIIRAISGLLFDTGANIVQSDQLGTDPEGGTFFVRMEFTLPRERCKGFREQFARTVAPSFEMDWRIWDTTNRKRVAILVSREEQCLLDLLWRWRRGELEAEDDAGGLKPRGPPRAG